jgi:hypothetical protein
MFASRKGRETNHGEQRVFLREVLEGCAEPVFAACAGRVGTPRPWKFSGKEVLVVNGTSPTFTTLRRNRLL